MKKKLCCGLLVIAICLSTRAQQKTLPIPPVYQQTPEWCWVTCGEMIFRYFGICPINPISYQCGIIALLAPQCYNSCLSCIVGAGTSQRIVNMLYQYPAVAANNCPNGKLHVTCTDLMGQCSANDLVNNIDADMPIMAGITPAGGGTNTQPAHVVLIVGYNALPDGTLWLIVNDPFPYAAFNMQDPYTYYQGQMLQQGQFAIRYSAFSTMFNWSRTLVDIQ
jgi:hypothetical protein